MVISAGMKKSIFVLAASLLALTFTACESTPNASSENAPVSASKADSPSEASDHSSAGKAQDEADLSPFVDGTDICSDWFVQAFEDLMSKRKDTLSNSKESNKSYEDRIFELQEAAFEVFSFKKKYRGIICKKANPTSEDVQKGRDKIDVNGDCDLMIKLYRLIESFTKPDSQTKDSDSSGGASDKNQTQTGTGTQANKIDSQSGEDFTEN